AIKAVARCQHGVEWPPELVDLGNRGVAEARDLDSERHPDASRLLDEVKERASPRLGDRIRFNDCHLGLPRLSSSTAPTRPRPLRGSGSGNVRRTHAVRHAARRGLVEDAELSLP